MLTAKVPTSHNGDCFPKSAFAIDLDRMEVRCPAGQVTTTISHPDRIAPGDSCLPTPLVRPVLYDPNASAVKGREASTSNTKNDCNNKPAP